jgi:hypothetical protein
MIQEITNHIVLNNIVFLFTKSEFFLLENLSNDSKSLLVLFQKLANPKPSSNNSTIFVLKYLIF